MAQLLQAQHIVKQPILFNQIAKYRKALLILVQMCANFKTTIFLTQEKYEAKRVLFKNNL